MHTKPLFPVLFLMLVFIGLLHVIAVKFYLYWSIGNLDMVSHLLGGALAALSVLWLVYLSGYFHHRKVVPLTAFVFSLAASIIIGVLWEVFELRFGITSLSDTYYFYENGADLLLDIAGGIVGYVYFSYSNYSKV